MSAHPLLELWGIPEAAYPARVIQPQVPELRPSLPTALLRAHACDHPPPDVYPTPNTTRIRHMPKVPALSSLRTIACRHKRPKQEMPEQIMSLLPSHPSSNTSHQLPQSAIRPVHSTKSKAWPAAFYPRRVPDMSLLSSRAPPPTIAHLLQILHRQHLRRQRHKIFTTPPTHHACTRVLQRMQPQTQNC
jgi:hypothetical protein